MLRNLLPLFASGAVLMAASTSPANSIGLVKSTGDFRVDGSAVHGNGNIFEGNLLETGNARSIVQLADAQITLAPDSRARIFHDHTVLEKGSGSIKAASRHTIDAESLRIVPGAAASLVQVDIAGPSRVIVASRGGAADVRNATGVLTAHLLPGMSLSFNPQSGADAAVTVTGVLKLKDGSFFVTDETTKVTVQVESQDAAQYVGKRVQVVGSAVAGVTPAGDATQVVSAITIKSVAAEAAAAGAAGAVVPAVAVPAAAGAGAAAGVGLSAVAIGAIVGGVAVAGVVGGLAASGSFSSSTPVSRP
jgi:hypothetical protein